MSFQRRRKKGHENMTSDMRETVKLRFIEVKK